MQLATRKDILVVRHTIIKICIESSSIGGEERSEGVERSVTIIPHLGGQESRFKKLLFSRQSSLILEGKSLGGSREKCKSLKMFRRRSMADYAFPELHPDTALRKSSRNLLIYTRTRCLKN